MNRKIGVLSALVLAACTALFFVCLAFSLIETQLVYAYISYAVCIVLSWAFVVVAVANQKCAPKNRSVAAGAGVVFATLYAAFINLVYFTQLTAVLHGQVPEQVRELFDFQAVGGWLFSLDLIGYGLMALSTLFMGLSFVPQNKNDRALKRLLLLHGAFVVSTVVPVTPAFVGAQGASQGGMIALLCWCVMFAPIALLFAKRFAVQREEGV